MNSLWSRQYSAGHLHTLCYILQTHETPTHSQFPCQATGGGSGNWQKRRPCILSSRPRKPRSGLHHRIAPQCCSSKAQCPVPPCKDRRHRCRYLDRKTNFAPYQGHRRPIQGHCDLRAQRRNRPYPRRDSRDAPGARAEGDLSEPDMRFFFPRTLP
ncbi:uncharacterized protein BDV17DRAFT_276349 [Aspergillus undulatus]|uniref:uncharacterized protein n=1 Tax=Aspergillus undulatus TaxID=1810928 RepID=UPI003CCE1C32